MKLLSVVFVFIFIDLQPVCGASRIIRLGSYSWISINGTPFIRLTRSRPGSSYLSLLRPATAFAQRMTKRQVPDYLETINRPMIRGQRYFSHPLFFAEKRNYDYKMDKKRTNYIRLAKRSIDDFYDPRIRLSIDDQTQYYMKRNDPSMVESKNDILYPVFAPGKKLLSHKLNSKRTNYIRLSKK